LLPSISIVVYILFVVTLFALQKLSFFIVLSALALVLLLLLPQRQLKSGFIPISIFLFATFLANILFSPGRVVIKVGPFPVTEEGLHIASVRTLRVFLLIAGAKFLTIIAGLDEMIQTMGRLLGPLEKIGVPVKEFFETMASAVRALPLIRKRIGEEYGQRMSGMERTTVMERIRLVFGFMLPVFIESIKNPESIFGDSKANTVSNSVNGPYGGDGKSMDDANG